MIYKSDIPDFDIPDLDIFTFLYHNNEYDQSPDKILSVQAENGASLTRAQIKDRVSRLAAGWKQTLGLGRGDVVAVFAPNQYDHVMLYLSLLATGCTITPGNPGYTESEFHHQVSNSGANALITVPELLPVLLKVCEQTGIQRDRIFVFGNQEADGILPFYSLIPKDGSRITEAPSGIVPSEDVAFICFSSGTTGKAKGVELTHRNFVGEIVTNVKFDPATFSDQDVLSAFLPFFHIYGLALCFNSFYRSSLMVVLKKFDLEVFLKCIQKYKVTIGSIVPPIAVILAKHPLVRQFDLSSLRILSSGAAPLGQEHIEAVNRVIPAVIRQGFGMTETTGGVIIQKSANIVPGSIGVLVANNQARIVDEQGNDVGPDQRGELLVRGVSVMKGYHNNPEANANTFTKDGWMRTGDVAVFRSDSKQFFIVDRMKELIKTNGFQVPPAELEALLLSNDKVADCAVVGVYSAKDATEYPRAYVVLQAGTPESEETAKEISGFVASRVVRYKRLGGGVRFIKAVPKSASGKILRKDIKQWIKEEESCKQSQAKL
ncbi:acetyl-CoA synthetase-like protein [Hesseltinella vesiculosa]|uniref:Acetyl-CoA synthetase-like protein n=1 Tax=Hesseltinella vesiculosa TaxID=101127 RepID=A0A1X2GX68_9FUNG|nr:acetyl-CoA synthetase-like protein [Hesseltinella vesiculosa]